MSSSIIEDDEQKIAGLATILTYNRFTQPKDHITESTFTKRRCSKPMTDEQIKEATKRSENAIKEIQDSEKIIQSSIKELDYQRIAGLIRTRHNTISFAGTLYVYDDGLYHKDDIKRIDSEIITELMRCEEFDGDDDISRAAHQVRHYLTYQIVEPEYPFNLTPNAFNLSNGVLLLNLETGTHDIVEHSPKYKFNYKLAVAYDKNAPVEEMQKYLESLGTPEKPIIQFLIQIIVHCLLSITGRVYKRSYFLRGDKDSGKSTFILMIVERFFGKDVCSSISLQDILHDKFTLAELDGKLLNAYSDLSNEKITNIGRYKLLTGGDYVTIQRKHQDPYKFINRAVMIFSGNSYPKIEGGDKAFWDRWIPVSFDKVFPIVTTFKDEKFTSQNMSGLLNLALKAVPDILKNGIQDNGSIMNEWLRDSNPSEEFIDKMMEKDPKAVLIKSHAFKRYQEYSEENDLVIIDPKVFTNTMRMKGYYADSRVKIKGRREHVYSGCKWIGEDAIYPDREDTKEKAPSEQENIIKDYPDVSSGPVSDPVRNPVSNTVAQQRLNCIDSCGRAKLDYCIKQNTIYPYCDEGSKSQ